MPDRSVLVVDDNPVNRFALRVLVERLGFAVEVAGNGPEALAAMMKRSFVAVLVDIMMPGMTGYETADRIRQMEFGTGVHTPVIAVTSLDRSAAVEASCARAGIDDVVTKPVDAGVLADVLKRWAGVTASSLPAEPPHASPVDALRALYGEDLPGILRTFFEVTNLLLARLENTLAKREDAVAQQVLHELKGAASQMRMQELTDLCRQMEAARQSGDWETMAALYAVLVQAFVRVRTVLDRETA